MVLEGGFKDGTHILGAPKETEDVIASTTMSSDEEEIGDNVSQGMKNILYDSLHETTNLNNEPFSKSPVHRETTQEANDDQATNPIHIVKLY